MAMAMLELLNMCVGGELIWDFVLVAIMAASDVNLRLAINKWK
jgi:hypothetical protein